MVSILERKELSKEQYEDRISNLPNSLIAQILSRLPTKYAVSTSVLSTRWKQLWTSITKFDIDDELLFRPQNNWTDPLRRSFKRFVGQVLLHHDSFVQLQSFRLKCRHIFDDSLVNGWITDALLRNVQELDLDLSDWKEHSSMLPQDLFTCRTLVVLQLKAHGYINCSTSVPSTVSLPSLRILHLSRIKFENEDSINRVLFGCPVLEDLSMSKCVGENVSVINIVAPRLTSLVMEGCMCPPHAFGRKIVLDTPALLYLKIHEFSKGGRYLVENIYRLIRADILFVDIDGSSKALTDLLKGIANVQFLQLSIESHYTRAVQLPKFPNMTFLELGYRVGRKFLLELLENSPHLEALVFKQGFGYDEVFTHSLWDPARNVPSCLLFCLKVVGFSSFRGGKEEWKMVDYFLQKGIVLEKVNIDYCYGEGSKWTIHRT